MQRTGSLDGNVQEHYTRRDLRADVLSALTAAGKDVDHLKAEDLAPIDEFHIRGREATIELAQYLRLDASKHVVDVGSGLGGASRYLASEFGCHVTGLDLTEEYCRVAQMLADRVGLSSRVTYRQGSALAMPFADMSFDVVWTQHASMNIADKDQLYAEIWRVLRPGGRFALYDILAGPGGALHFPVPWARDSTLNFLIAPDALRQLLERIGFHIVSWRDTSAAGRDWFQGIAAKMKAHGGGPPLGFQVLLGADFRTMAQNQVRNLNENRIVLLEAVADRPAPSITRHPRA
jgi:ubiquinone/menaquinone biosynthesis C-methylase UbiE